MGLAATRPLVPIPSSRGPFKWGPKWPRGRPGASNHLPPQGTATFHFRHPGRPRLLPPRCLLARTTSPPLHRPGDASGSAGWPLLRASLSLQLGLWLSHFLLAPLLAEKPSGAALSFWLHPGGRWVGQQPMCHHHVTTPARLGEGGKKVRGPLVGGERSFSFSLQSRTWPTQPPGMLSWPAVDL